MAEQQQPAKPPVTIKKYANRRLYNTASSSYVTLEHLKRLDGMGGESIFRVRVDDMEGPIDNALGAVWMRWRGDSSETLRTRVGATTVEVRLQRESVQTASPSPTPAVVPPRVTTPAAPAAPPPRTRGTSRSRRRDAGPSGRDKPPELPTIELPL